MRFPGGTMEDTSKIGRSSDIKYFNLGITYHFNLLRVNTNVNSGEICPWS